MSSATPSAAVRPLGLAGRMAVLGFLLVGATLGASSGLGLLLFLPYASVGGLLVMRRPRMSIGWILLGLAGCFASISTALDATIQQFADGTVAPPLAVFAVAWNMSGVVAFFLFAILALVFPSGRLPTGGWGAVVRFTLACGVLFLMTAVVMPNLKVQLVGYAETVVVRNPLALLPDLAIWKIITPDTTTFLPIMVLLVVAAISLVLRVRRALGIERQQLRWFTASIAAVVAAVIIGMALASIVPGGGISGIVWIPALVAITLVPIAVGIAVLRYRLYEIDRIISRTVSWALGSGVLVVVFGAGVVALQALLSGFTQGETLAVAASTLIAYAIFQPVRRRIQRAVDRRFDRARYDGQTVIDAFARQLRDEVDLDRLRTALVDTADEVVRPVSASVWLRSGETGR